MRRAFYHKGLFELAPALTADDRSRLALKIDIRTVLSKSFPIHGQNHHKLLDLDRFLSDFKSSRLDITTSESYADQNKNRTKKEAVANNLSKTVSIDRFGES
jgi:hypothetical protein